MPENEEVIEEIKEEAPFVGVAMRHAFKQAGLTDE